MQLKNKSNISKKNKKKLSKLQGILANLRQVLKILVNTEKDIRNTLEVIKKAAAAFS